MFLCYIIEAICNITPYSTLSIETNEDDYFIVAARYSIARISLDGQRSKVLSSNSSNANAIDYDYK